MNQDGVADAQKGADKVGSKASKRVSGKGRKLKQLRRRAKAAEAAALNMQQQIEDQPAFPVARPARMRRRHWGILLSFVLFVLAPLCAVIFYLMTIAEDQYVSTAGFVVRSQETSGSSEMLRGLGGLLTGGTTASDSDVLYAFIQSQEIVDVVEKQVGLREHFSTHWPKDWAFALRPEASLEDLTNYWQRILGISYEPGSGLIEVRASAYDPQTAQAITSAIVNASQDRVNALNEQAREDAMRYALADLDEALERLKEAREAMTQFRTRTRIVDPSADIQGRMGVMNNLQQQLATALVEFDLMRASLNPDDPRLRTAERTITVIRERIDIERQSFASSDNTETGAVGEDYPSLISEFERLSVDQDYAEQAYRAALTALEVARDEASRQSRYLATYIKPSLAESSTYPNRPILIGLAGLMLVMVWAIFVLIYYSIRDRS
jgi:capsular polysaccharide transport system permease protein